MERKELKTEIISLIKEVTKAENFHMDMDLMDDIGLSSIDLMDLVAKSEVKFGVKISSRDLRKVHTLGDLTDMVESKF